MEAPLPIPAEVEPSADAPTGLRALQPVDSSPLGPLNELMLGAPSLAHLENRAIPMMESCLAGAGIIMEIAPEEVFGSTYGDFVAERERGIAISRRGASPVDQIADAFRLLSATEQSQALWAIEGTESCYVTALAEAEGPFVIRDDDAVRDVIIPATATAEAADAAESYRACMAGYGVVYGQGESVWDVTLAQMERATPSDAAKQMKELAAADLACAPETVWPQNWADSVEAIAELVEREVITEAVATQLLTGTP